MEQGRPDQEPMAGPSTSGAAAPAATASASPEDGEGTAAAGPSAPRKTIQPPIRLVNAYNQLLRDIADAAPTVLTLTRSKDEDGVPVETSYAALTSPERRGHPLSIMEQGLIEMAGRAGPGAWVQPKVLFGSEADASTKASDGWILPRSGNGTPASAAIPSGL